MRDENGLLLATKRYLLERRFTLSRLLNSFQTFDIYGAIFLNPPPHTHTHSAHAG